MNLKSSVIKIPLHKKKLKIQNQEALLGLQTKAVRLMFDPIKKKNQKVTVVIY